MLAETPSYLCAFTLGTGLYFSNARRFRSNLEKRKSNIGHYPDSTDAGIGKAALLLILRSQRKHEVRYHRTATPAIANKVEPPSLVELVG